MDRHTWEQLGESPGVVTFPLLMLAIPSLVIGALLVGPMVLGDYFADAIRVAADHAAWSHEMTSNYSGALDIFLNSYKHAPVWLALAGISVAWLCYIVFPHWPARIAASFALVYRLFARKFYFDEIYQAVFCRGARNAGSALWQWGDVRAIDGLLVNGNSQRGTPAIRRDPGTSDRLPVPLRVCDDHRPATVAGSICAPVGISPDFPACCNPYHFSAC